MKTAWSAHNNAISLNAINLFNVTCLCNIVAFYVYRNNNNDNRGVGVSVILELKSIKRSKGEFQVNNKKNLDKNIFRKKIQLWKFCCHLCLLQSISIQDRERKEWPINDAAPKLVIAFIGNLFKFLMPFSCSSKQLRGINSNFFVV